MKRIILLMLLGSISLVHYGATVRTDSLQRGDTLYVITTACAPVCSSIVQAYNQEGKLLGEIPAPDTTAIFPEAYIENNRILWRDNTEAILDDEERKH